MSTTKEPCPTYIELDLATATKTDLSYHCHTNNIPDIGCKTKKDFVARIQKFNSQPAIYEGWSREKMTYALRGRGLVCPCDDQPTYRLSEGPPKHASHRRTTAKADSAAVDKKRTNPNAARIAKLKTALQADDRDARFRLVDLPSELRNIIYGFALTEHAPAALTCPNVPALCQVSNQVRQETLGLWLSQNTFLMRIDGPYTEFLSQHRREHKKPKVNAEDARW